MKHLKRITKGLQVLAWLSLSSLLLLLAAASALWVWTGADSSLAFAAQQATRFLPSGHSLTLEGVQGSLRHGGHIERLRWQHQGLTVEAQQIDLAWTPAALRQRTLQLDRLHVARLQVDDQRPASPTVPPQDLTLPLQVDARVQLDALQLTGATTLEASAISGHYVFDSETHRFDEGKGRFSSTNYAVQLSLGAQAPLALSAQLKGALQAPVPGSSRTLALTAQASAQGELAGAHPALQVQATLAQTAAPAAPTGSVAVRANVSAQLDPWASQPITQGNADFAGVNLALLWPGAPQTALTGQVNVVPLAGSTGASTASVTPEFRAQGSIRNSASGPWDQGRLPLDSVQAALSFSGNRWNVQTLSASLAGGGQLQVKGSAAADGTSATSGWQGQATLQNINPAALHTRLAATRVGGTLTAEAVQNGINFNLQLLTSGAARVPQAAALMGLRLQSARLQGRWANGTLSLPTLQVQTDDAALSGDLVLQTTGPTANASLALQSGKGQLHLTLPGGQADLTGQLAALQGDGNLVVRVADATRASRWVARLPGVPASAAALLLQGQAELTARWQGGWQSLQSPQGRDASLAATLRIPNLDVRQDTPASVTSGAVRLREVTAQLSGRLSALTLGLQGQLQSGNRSLSLQSQASGGRGSNGDWQAQIKSATLTLRDSLQASTANGTNPGSGWTLQTREVVTLDWKTSLDGGTLSSSAGEATLRSAATGLRGEAVVAWQPLYWRHQSGTPSRDELRSQGSITGLPMAWGLSLGNTSLAQTGVNGDLVFDGSWDVSAADSLKLQATLVRRNGDIRVLAQDGDAQGTDASGIDAGVKDARLTLTADGTDVRASLRWDSLRAGQVQADLRTRITVPGNTAPTSGWAWPLDAPLSGTIRAQLPQVGVWSVLAPPGWRIRGTLDAQVELSGSRQSPQWHGTLNANDLALRAVADGIEFSQGQLRSTLDGQRLSITRFSLQGARGNAAAASGGSLTATGFALWSPDTPTLSAPASAPSSATAPRSPLQNLRVELAAQAQALRLSSRADRRLAVSGQVKLLLAEARLQVRGQLQVDQALFILPDESTPTLGSDVSVKPSASNRSAVRPANAAPGAVTSAPNTANVALITPDVMLTLDMGNDFRVQGRGIVTRLAGSLNVVAVGLDAAPRLTGELRTASGSYKAYGQQLNIEEGVMRFTGPYDNPALDILATRPNLTVRVGVQISGTALSPKVRLFADPDLPDAEKLAWLVLGRSAANGGAEAAVLQQAALALLGGNGKGLSGGIAEAFGLDELSFRGSADNTDGTTTAAAVTLGKRLSKDFYVAYERSLAGTLGTVYIFYDLSRRFTLRAQTGEQSAIDLIFTVPYD